MIASCVVIGQANVPLAVTVGLLVLGLREWRKQLSLRGDDGAAIEAAGSRRTAYWSELAVGAAGARDLRVFGLGGWARERHYRQATEYLHPLWRARRDALRGQRGVVALMAGTAAVIFAWPSWLAWNGQIGTAGFVGAIVAGSAAYFATWPSGRAQMTSFAVSALAAVDYLERRASENAPAPFATSSDGQIRLERVSFGYGDGPLVIDHFDLDIAPGEVVGLVGVNGAGKTTLAKLLTGLYQPTTGSVSWPGNSGPPSNTAVLFSDFVRYPLTLAENVAISSDGPIDRDAVLDSIRLAAGEDLVEQLPFGIDTVLSKQQRDGIDLSGGQWQRVALARILYAVRGGKRLVVMDEPTAFLDAAIEAEFFDQIVRNLNGASVVLISHRLSTVRSADRIALLDGGRLTECGTHGELMTAGGRYASLFRLQASRFEAAGNNLGQGLD
ncbi:ATP-binding cassette domain-containing protein [Microlunatus elymi]|nr:ABC transporter ATP-binding protein [Microlunatus elymi]